MTLDLSPVIHQKVLSSNSLINTNPEKSYRNLDIFPCISSYLDLYICTNNLKIPFQHCWILFGVTSIIPEIFPTESTFFVLHSYQWGLEFDVSSNCMNWLPWNCCLLMTATLIHSQSEIFGGAWLTLASRNLDPISTTLRKNKGLSLLHHGNALLITTKEQISIAISFFSSPLHTHKSFCGAWLTCSSRV